MQINLLEGFKKEINELWINSCEVHCQTMTKLYGWSSNWIQSEAATTGVWAPSSLASDWKVQCELKNRGTVLRF